MPMGESLVQKLRIPQMVFRNTDSFETAIYGVDRSCETTTGITAAERSLTAMKSVEDDTKPEDFKGRAICFL